MKKKGRKNLLTAQTYVEFLRKGTFKYFVKILCLHGAGIVNLSYKFYPITDFANSAPSVSRMLFCMCKYGFALFQFRRK